MALTSSLTNAYADEVSESYILPMEYDVTLSPMPIIRMSINGSRPLRFVVDTGMTGMMLLDRKTADKLKLKPTRKKKTMDPGNVQVHGVAVNSIVALGIDEDNNVGIGITEVYAADLPILQESFAVRADGILGQGFLPPGRICFDFAAKKLIITLGKGPHPAIKDAIEVSLQKKEDGYYATALLNERVPVLFLLDTGSKSTTVAFKSVKNLKALAISSAMHATLAGWSEAIEVLIGSLEIGGTSYSKVTVLSNVSKTIQYGKHKEEPNDAILGLNFLSRFRVTLDVPGRKMYLEGAGEDSPDAITGKAEVLVSKKGQNYYVKSVEKASLAEQSGVEVGARLISVDGRKIMDLPIAVVQKLLNKSAGDRAELLLESKNKKTPYSYMRSSWYSASSKANLETNPLGAKN